MTTGVQIEGVRLPQQLHIGFNVQLSSLATIAEMAASNEILPTRCASAGAWHHVIKGQVTRRKNLAAVLTGVAIAQENILARKSPGLMRNPAVREEANDRGQAQSQPRTLEKVSDCLLRHR